MTRIALALAITVGAGVAAPAGPVERVVQKYDISFLTAPVPQHEVRDWAYAGALSLGGSAPNAGPLGELAGKPSRGGGAVDIDLGLDDAPTGQVLSASSIERLIEDNIEPDSWSNDRNSIGSDDKYLVVVQTPAVHKSIAGLLDQLRARRASMYVVEVAIVPPSALNGSSGILKAEDFDSVLERAAEGGQRFALTAYNEQAVSTFTGRRRTTAIDTEINSTGVIPVSNTVVLTLPIGVTVQARPTAITGTDWVRLELKVVRMTENGRPTIRKTFYSEIESIPLAERMISGRVVLNAEQCAVVGRFAESEGGQALRELAVLARLRPMGARASATESKKSDGGFRLKVYDIGELTQTSGDAGAKVEEILTLLKYNVAADAWKDNRSRLEVHDDKFLFVKARQDTHDSVGEWISRRLESRAELASVDTVVLEGDVAAAIRFRRESEGGVFPTATWTPATIPEGLELTYRGTSTARLGERAEARGAEVRTYIADVELVSGGTGFSVIEMPDTVIASSGDGYETWSRVSRSGSGLVHLEHGLFRSKTTFARSGEFYAGVQVADRSQRTQQNQSPSKTAYVLYEVGLPSQRSLSARSHGLFPEGRYVISRIDRTAEGKARIVLFRATVDRRKGGER
ncbi:MAG: hypothetical protein AAF517_10255 [Planctomycetota bacterium]